MLDARARARRRELTLGVGQRARAALRRRPLRRRHGRLRRAQLLRPRPRAAPRWRASCGPAGASSCSRSRRRRGRRCRPSSALWFDRVVPLIGRARRRRRRLQLPAELGQALPRPAGARRGDGRARACDDIRYVLTAGGIIAIHVGTKRVSRDGRADRPSVVARRRATHVPALLARVEERLRRARRAGHGALLAEHARRDDRRRRQAPAPAARAARRAADARGRRAALVARRRRGRARPQRDARPRRRARRRRRCAAARPTVVAAAGRDVGDRDRRPAVLARVRRAGRATGAPTRSACSRDGELGARARASCCSAPTPGTPTVARRALPARCELKTARLFEAACELGALRGRRRRPRALGAFGRRIGLAFQLLDDVLDVSGPAERTGKHRGTDLLDGTVTLPFILARERDPRARARSTRARSRRRSAAEERLRPDRGHRRAGRGARARALEIVDEAKAGLPAGLSARQRHALELVATASSRATPSAAARPARHAASGERRAARRGTAASGRLARRSWHAVSVTDERTSYDVWGAAIALQAALSMLLGLVLDLHLGADRRRLLLADVGAVRARRAARDPARDPPRAARAPRIAGARWRSMPPPRAGSRPCSSRSTRSPAAARSGRCGRWPTLGLALGAHAIIVVALPSLRPQERELTERVDELTRTRRGALDVQAAELRRIERDLHDGAQARLVALSMQLGRAEERLEDHPEAAELVRSARDEASAAIGELRDLARGIAPPVLADRGLRGGGRRARRALARCRSRSTRALDAPAAAGRRVRRLLRRRRVADQRRQARRAAPPRTVDAGRGRRPAGRRDRRRRARAARTPTAAG